MDDDEFITDLASYLLVGMGVAGLTYWTWYILEAMR